MEFWYLKNTTEGLICFKGVLIIELLTNKPPWKEHENMEIVKMVAYEGKHHPIPTGTPQEGKAGIRIMIKATMLIE